jgi:hypothetical protein
MMISSRKNHFFRCIGVASLKGRVTLFLEASEMNYKNTFYVTLENAFILFFKYYISPIRPIATKIVPS